MLTIRHRDTQWLRYTNKVVTTDVRSERDVNADITLWLDGEVDVVDSPYSNVLSSRAADPLQCLLHTVRQCQEKEYVR